MAGGFSRVGRALHDLVAWPGRIRESAEGMRRLHAMADRMEADSAALRAQQDLIHDQQGRMHALLLGVRETLAASPKAEAAYAGALAGRLDAIDAGWRSQAAALDSRLAAFARSAPGRGNLALPGGRLLLRVSLPELFPHGDPILFVNADDKLIVPKLAMTGHYELECSHFVARSVKPEDHVFDVGANFGYFTVMMGILAGWKGKVVAFEPHPGLAAMLRENKLINWIDPWVSVVEGACMETAGEWVTLHESQARLANTGLAPAETRDGAGDDFASRSFQVKSVRVDDSLAEVGGRVDFMKVDIEGAEPFALRGARQTIAANPQIRIMMEWSPGQLRALGVDLADFARELEGFGLPLHSLYRGGPPGAATPMEFAELPSLDYQNIVLMRAPA